MKLESGCSILEDELTPYNYKEKFHHLLCWEEKEHDKQISEKYVNYIGFVVVCKYV